MTTAQRPPRLLTIAGSDSGGGAGIQADLKTFEAHGGFGMSAITAVTAQNTRSVTAIHAVPAAVVVAQIDAVFDDIGVDAVKIGMLGDAAVVGAVAASLSAHPVVPVVLDPVMIAKSGDALLADDAIDVLVEELWPRATLLTPNVPEAIRLSGRSVATEAERRALAREMAARGSAVLLKGGHAEGDEVVDLLAIGDEVHRYAHPRIDTAATHGTGCTLSAAIAARLGRGEPLVDAVAAAIDYLRGAMVAAAPLGGGHGPVHHHHGLTTR